MREYGKYMLLAAERRETRRGPQGPDDDETIAAKAEFGLDAEDRDWRDQHRSYSPERQNERAAALARMRQRGGHLR